MKKYLLAFACISFVLCGIFLVLGFCCANTVTGTPPQTMDFWENDKVAVAPDGSSFVYVDAYWDIDDIQHHTHPLQLLSMGYFAVSIICMLLGCLLVILNSL